MADIGGPWTLVVPRHQGTKAPVNTCAWPLTSAVPAPLAESCRRRPPARCSQVRRRACAVRNARMLASWVACAGPPQCVRGALLTTCGRPRPFWRLLPARRSRPSSQPCGVVRCWSCCWWLDARLVWARYATMWCMESDTQSSRRCLPARARCARGVAARLECTCPPSAAGPSCTTSDPFLLGHATRTSSWGSWTIRSVRCRCRGRQCVALAAL